MIGDLERDRRAREDEHDRDDRRGTPGRTTLTSRLQPTSRSIAREVLQLMQLQANGDLNGPDVHEVAAHGMTGGGTSLPYLDQIQRAFGHHDIGGVRAHIGGVAGQASEALGARAYASGDAVAFGSAPDLHLAAHEAAHVVQQRGGVRLSGGVGRAGDEYEVNADAVADRVVRGESAQDLLDRYSHRGSSGGSAVQRQEHDESSAGLSDLNRMLLRGAPTPRQIVACMRRHSGDARAILARVRERLGEGVALSVEVEVGMTAPELVPVLGSERAHGTSPVGTAETGRGGGLGADAPPRREATPAPIDAHGAGDRVVAAAHPDEHTAIEATLETGEDNPLRGVRVVISDETDTSRSDRDEGHPEASVELAADVDLETGRTRGSASTRVSPMGDRGPTLSGEAAVSVGTGEDGRPDVRGSGRLEISVPVADHAELVAAGVITERGHVVTEASVTLLQRVRGLPAGNAAREPMLRLFISVDHDIAGGTTSIDGGAALQFDRDGGEHDDPGEIHRLATAGTSGSGSSIPHLDRIQAAFGHHDITGVRAHVGGAAAAAAGAMGARGYASGNAIAFAASPDLHLAAHEAAHVVQQRGGVRLSGGVGRAGDEYEQHADAVADLVVRGESAQSLLDQRAHRGAAGGSAVQLDHEEDVVWLATLHHDDAGHYTAADGRELTRAEQRRLRRILREDAVREAPSERPETVARDERHASTHTGTAFERTELDEARDRRAGGVRGRSSDRHSPDGYVLDSASGGRTRRSVRLGDDTPARRDTIDETRTQITDSGAIVERHEEGTRALRMGPDRTAADIHDELERRDAALASRLAASTNEVERTRITGERRRLRRDIETLAEPDASEADTTRIGTRYGLGDTLEEDVTATTTSTDLNPFDGTMGDATETARDVRELEGASARTVDRRSRGLDVGGGTYEDRAEEERTATSADGSSMTERSSRSTRVEADDGRVMGTRSRRAESSARRADGSTERRATEAATSAGAIVTEDETGGRVAHTRRIEREVGGITGTGELSGAVEVTDRRVGGSGSAMGSVRRGDYTGTARVSGDGSFSIDVTPLDDGSGEFRLTFTIHLGVSGEGSVAASDTEGDAQGGGSVAVRGSARGDLVTSRVIDEAEARRYTEAAEAADRGEEVSEPAEFGRLARLRAGIDNADALMNTTAVFGSGSTAAAMADGESVTLDTEVGVGATASGSLTGTGGGMSLGASGEVAGDARWRRTVQVERITVGGLARVRVTVTYRDESERSATGTVSSSIGAARGRVAEEAGATDAVQFVIDPNATDYEERYDAIVSTTDQEQLRALEARYVEDVGRSRHADTGAEETEYEFGPTSSAMIGTRTRTTSSDDVTVVTDPDGHRSLEAEIEGGSDSDVRVRAGSHDLDLGGHRDTARGTVDRAHGARVDIEAAEESIDPAAALSDARDALSEADGVRERAALVMARTPSEHLRNALREFGHVWGYHLDGADLDSMGERAADEGNWSGCCIVPDEAVIAAWNRLRLVLARPRLDPAEEAVDRPAAISIARIRALTTWMRAADSHGAECIERVLRRWGESTTHEVDAARLGEGYEWPVSLRDAHERYTRLVTQVEGMRDRFEGALAREHGDTDAQGYYQAVSSGLDAVLGQVRSNSDFTSEARRSEMIQDIEQHRAEVRQRYQDFVRRWGELHNESGGEGPTADDIEATRASSAETTAARSREYVNAGVRTCRDNHRRETQMLQQVQAIMRDVGDSTLFGHSQRAEAATICSQIHDLHRTWIQQVQDLRQAYSQAGTAESAWQVSTGPGTRRSRTLEPNVGWLIIEYSRVMENSYDAYWESRVGEWREEGREY